MLAVMSHDPAVRCPACAWPLSPRGAVRLSRHATSAGTVEYWRCVCGAWVVVSGTLTAVVAPEGNREPVDATNVGQ